MKETNIDKIKKTIDDLRPYLMIEGGDAEFIKYDEETHTVYVKLIGNCATCLAQDDTLELGLLGAIKESVEEVENIVNVSL